jgi:deferrochelatase/peroxidase EfeB
MLVGRFENGMPVVLSSKANQLSGKVVNTNEIAQVNDFNYSVDSDAAKCPFHAHIRKTNPRGEGLEEIERQKTHMIARRGITYGKRNANETVESLPTKDIGLLFMCFQADIGKQFELMQELWANSSDFVKNDVGRDPVIGSLSSSDSNKKHHYPKVWGDKNSIIPTSPFANFVTLKGGEYFFAPSLTFLKSLNTIS